MTDPLLNDIEQTFITELCKQALHTIKSAIGRWNVDVDSSDARMDSAIQAHLREVRRWSEEISFKDLLNPKSTSEVFVPLDIYLLPRRQRLINESIPSVPLAKIIENEDSAHLVILGQPGAGKTTSVKHLCQRMLTEDNVCKGQNFPVLIRLRELNQAKPASGNPEDLLLERLQSILNIPLVFPTDLAGDDSTATRRSILEGAVLASLETLQPLILLDGLDEVSHKLRRDSIVSGIRRLAIQLEKAKIILTARTGEFTYHVEKMATYEIAPLSDKQIQQFASAWLGTTDSDVFLNQVRHSPFADTAIKPLTLAHLCAIFERVRRIPEKPKSVYRKIVSLLLEDWDEQRSVSRVSSYSDFEVDRKAEFLADLAHSLTSFSKTSTFTSEDLKESFREICGNYGLRTTEAEAVVNELETHTGLIVQAGTEIYEFSHKSLQEYLTAMFIVGLPGIPPNMIELQIMPNELAIATALSSRPSKYFYILVIEHFSQIKLSFQFVRTFLNRMLIERPDFELNNEVGLAILCLYSQYLRASIDEAAQLQLFINDPLALEFENLNELIRERIKIADLLAAYGKVGEAFGLDGEEIWTLETKERAEGPFRLYTRNRILPSMLWVRRSLLEGSQEDL